METKNTNDNTNDETNLIFFGLAFLGILCIIIYSLQFNLLECLSVIAIGITVSFSAFVVGGLGGFLFGLPKTQPDSTKTQPDSKFKDNANLEEISDWLTKALVGIGLSQIQTLFENLKTLAVFLSPAFGNKDSSGILAISLIILFIIDGFLFSYLKARILLANLLGHVEQIKINDSIKIDNIKRQSTPLIIHKSAVDDTLQKNPNLKDKKLALVGLKVHHGQVIDAITPIFAVIESTPDLKLGETVDGEHYGGQGGGETILKKDGCILTGLNYYKGNYFGRIEVVQIELIWHKLTQKGIDPDEIVSEKLGTGEFAKQINLFKLRAETDCYISNLSATTSYHTSGETYLNDLSITQEKLPNKSQNQESA